MNHDPFTDILLKLKLHCPYRLPAFLSETKIKIDENRLSPPFNVQLEEWLDLEGHTQARQDTAVWHFNNRLVVPLAVSLRDDKGNVIFTKVRRLNFNAWVI